MAKSKAVTLVTVASAPKAAAEEWQMFVCKGVCVCD